MTLQLFKKVIELQIFQKSDVNGTLIFIGLFLTKKMKNEERKKNLNRK